MIWINTGKASYLAVACNTAEKAGKHSLWIQRMDGTNIKVIEGDEKDIKETKEAIDYSVENGITVFNV